MVKIIGSGMANEHTFYMEGEIDVKADVGLFSKQFQEGLKIHMGMVYALNYYYFHKAFKMTYPLKQLFRLSYDRDCNVNLEWDDGK